MESQIPASTVGENRQTVSQSNIQSHQPSTRSTTPGTIGVPRPYRSHKIRACDLCRRRKVRCAVDISGQPCTLCRSQGVECQYRNKQRTPYMRSERRSIESQRDIPGISAALPVQSSILNGALDKTYQRSRPSYESERLVNFDSTGQGNQPSPTNACAQSTHIIGPVVAQDVQVLEQYMSPDENRTSQAGAPQARYGLYSADPAEPVLYTMVQRRREGLPMTMNPGSKERDILDQIMMPMKHEIVNSFFEHFNSSFPMLDSTISFEFHKDWSQNISQTVVCEIYAIALTYWNQARGRGKTPVADHRFVWNLAVKALRDDFMAPGLSTVQAALLDLAGRPIFSMTGNGITNGRTVSLSYSLGLNRDPSRWNISDSEKDLRIRLWWGVLIHDRWGSFSHGTPPHISKGHYNVPLPQVNLLRQHATESSDHERRLECFVMLCSLTEILGDVLPLVYDQNILENAIIKQIRRLKVDLDLWEDSLPEFISMDEPRDTVVSGSSSLKLGFLTIKMLICRVELHAITHSSTPDTIEVRQYHQAECRKSARMIVDFVVSLTTSNLHEFWLPYSAYHLGSTATLLLRFALETTDDEIAESCIANARALVSRLRRTRDEDDWDLADFCLLQCEDVLHRMTTNADNGLSQSTANVPPDLDLHLPDFEATLPEGAYEMDNGSNIHFHDLWDLFRFEESDFH